jgi:hypothetical protein
MDPSSMHTHDDLSQIARSVIRTTATNPFSRTLSFTINFSSCEIACYLGEGQRRSHCLGGVREERIT